MTDSKIFAYAKDGQCILKIKSGEGYNVAEVYLYLSKNTTETLISCLKETVDILERESSETK